MKKSIKLIALLKGQNGMKTMKRFLIASMVLGTVFFATINVVVNEKSSSRSNLTLLNLEAFANETGNESGAAVIIDIDPNKCDTRLISSSNSVSYTVIYSCSPHDVSFTCKEGWAEIRRSDNAVLDTYTCSMTCQYANYSN
ncbi:MAG: hypothetical protein LBE13_00210 [Bacteroidales bacterium]|jgi:hypothetical protein|nr:hypothetical protein [Bacteroidales bacterium]